MFEKDFNSQLDSFIESVNTVKFLAEEGLVPKGQCISLAKVLEDLALSLTLSGGNKEFSNGEDRFGNWGPNESGEDS